MTTEAESPPPVCPFCQSLVVSTTSKSITETTYWRCGTCGQIWNPSRLVAQRPRVNRW
jgi:ribosomal protein L37AE/L43A